MVVVFSDHTHFLNIFPNFRKKGMIFLNGNSHEISCFIYHFEKAVKFKIVVCCKLKVALYGLNSRFWVLRGTVLFQFDVDLFMMF